MNHPVAVDSIKCVQHHIFEEKINVIIGISLSNILNIPGSLQS